MTSFFASDLRPLASAASIHAGFGVRRTIALSHAHQMPEIKLQVSQDDFDQLNAEAAAAGTSRAALIRDRALSRPTTTEYHALVADAVAFMRGDLPRMQVETLTAYVIARLYKHPPQAVASHQPAA